MARISEETKQRVIEANDIVEIIQRESARRLFRKVFGKRQDKRQGQ